MFGDDGDDLMLALARKIVNGEEEDEAETVEAVFAQARDAEAVGEELLVDEGWKAVEVEPEAVAVNGNGHRDEAPEPQQSLFSWAARRSPLPRPCSIGRWTWRKSERRSWSACLRRPCVWAFFVVRKWPAFSHFFLPDSAPRKRPRRGSSSSVGRTGSRCPRRRLRARSVWALLRRPR